MSTAPWNKLIAEAADREAAAAGWERLWQAAPHAVRAQLEQDQGLAQAVTIVMGASLFLTETLVQFSQLVPWLGRVRQQRSDRSPDAWAAALGETIAGVAPQDRANVLTRFKRQETLRIAVRDLTGMAPLAETTAALSQLADTILEQAQGWAWNELVGRYGTPRGLEGEGVSLCVLGLGKLGGGELNYSSDIDLMFVYGGDGSTAGGGEELGNREFFSRQAQALLRTVGAVTAAGPAYRVDLRLRPGGREGELVLPLAAARAYYREQARPWELQMLIRARASAGDRDLGRRLLSELSRGIYPVSPDAAALTAGTRRLRQQRGEELTRARARQRTPAELDIKLDPGGIRDIEFLVQYLQRRYGGAEPWVRGGNTLVAMQRLHDKRLLAAADFRLLANAYQRWRELEHRLQLRLGQQTHSLPTEAARLEDLARGLGSGSGRELTMELGNTMQAVRQCYERYVQEAPAVGVAATAARAAPLPGPPEARHAAELRQRFWRSATTNADTQAALAALEVAGRDRLEWALDHSDWMAEALIRRPDLALSAPAAAAAPAAVAEAMVELRRQWQQGMLAVFWQEWHEREAIALALRRITDLADQLIAAGLHAARSEAPAAPSFAVLGLGRLGLAELDVLSDLDLVFVSEPEERECATRLAAKLMEVLTAYTGAGSLFAVDLRLRPGGGEGELVQTPGTLASYFAGRAGSWEALSYLKARRVAGDANSAGRALSGVRTAVQARFHDVSASELAELRGRIEHEGKPGVWGFKTPSGGYYDADFVIALHQLRSGAWPRVGVGLAEWARQLGRDGGLPTGIASELADAVNWLRTADHALRVGTGRAGRAVPASGAGVVRATAWLRHLGQLPADESLAAAAAAQRGRIAGIYRDWLL